MREPIFPFLFSAQPKNKHKGRELLELVNGWHGTLILCSWFMVLTVMQHRTRTMVTVEKNCLSNFGGESSERRRLDVIAPPNHSSFTAVNWPNKQSFLLNVTRATLKFTSLETHPFSKSGPCKRYVVKNYTRKFNCLNLFKIIL